MSAAPEVHDNPAEQRYELAIGDDMAVAEYAVDGKVIRFTHTFVPEALRGKGLATRVVKAALEGAQAQGYKVDPQCPTFATYVKSHPETQASLTDDAKAALGL